MIESRRNMRDEDGDFLFERTVVRPVSFSFGHMMQIKWEFYESAQERYMNRLIHNALLMSMLFSSTLQLSSS